MRVLVLCDLSEPPPKDHSYDVELKQDENWKSEANVLATLERLGHKPTIYGAFDDLEGLTAELKRTSPDLIFNLAEAFGGNRSLEPNLPALFELLGIPYTGASPAA